MMFGKRRIQLFGQASRRTLGAALGAAAIAAPSVALPIMTPPRAGDPYLAVHPHSLAGGEVEQLRGAEPEQARFDVTHASIDLTIDSIGIGTGTISGSVATSFVALAVLPRLVLDLHRDLVVSDVTGADGVTVASWEHLDDRLIVTFDTPVGVGDSGTVDVAYSGSPGAVTGPISDPPFVFGERDGAPYAFTLSVPYRSWGWWPCKETLTDKFTVDLACTVPTPLSAVSNGVLQAAIPGVDTTRFEWAHGFPVAPYLVSLAIAEYTQLTDTASFAVDGSTVTVPLEYWVYPDRVDDAMFDFERVPRMLETYSNQFGVYPFAAEKLGYALIEWGGGMEHQTCVSLGSRFVTGTRSEEWVIAHELGHQWFGDWLTVADFRDVWLNEGFATYCEALWSEEIGGRQAYFDRMRFSDFFPPPDFSGFSGTVYDPAPLYGPTPYRKGGWVLHMLRNEIGDDAFFDTLRQYVAERGNGNTSTSQFQAVAESVSGRDLETFFHQWIYVGGRPDYRFSWGTAVEGGGTVVRARISQAQTHLNAYQMRLPLAIITGSDTTWVHVESRERDSTFSIAVDSAPDDVQFDPEGWILRNTTSTSPLSRLTFIGPSRNPSRGPVAVRYTLDLPVPVSLSIFDVAGRRVRLLVDNEVQLGTHSPLWDGRDNRGAPLGGGVYYLELRAGSERLTSRIVRTAR